MATEYDYHISDECLEFYYTQTKDGIMIHEDCEYHGIIKSKTIDDFRHCSKCAKQGVVVAECPFRGNLCYVDCVDNDALLQETLLNYQN